MGAVLASTINGFNEGTGENYEVAWTGVPRPDPAPLIKAAAQLREVFDRAQATKSCISNHKEESWNGISRLDHRRHGAGRSRSGAGAGCRAVLRRSGDGQSQADSSDR